MVGGRVSPGTLPDRRGVRGWVTVDGDPRGPAQGGWGGGRDPTPERRGLSPCRPLPEPGTGGWIHTTASDEEAPRGESGHLCCVTPGTYGTDPGLLYRRDWTWSRSPRSRLSPGVVSSPDAWGGAPVPVLPLSGDRRTWVERRGALAPDGTRLGETDLRTTRIPEPRPHPGWWGKGVRRLFRLRRVPR